MPSSHPSLAVIGNAGSGVTWTLQQWVEGARRATGLDAAWFDGRRPGEALAAHIERATDGAPLVVDGAEHLDTASTELLVGAMSRHPIGVGVAPWPRSTHLDVLLDAVERTGTVQRTEPFDTERIVELVERHGVTGPHPPVDVVHRITAGSPALVVDVLATGWDGDLDAVPTAVSERVARRLGGAAPDVVHALRLIAVGAPTNVAFDLLEPTSVVDDLERTTRAGGWLVADGVVPLVAAVILAETAASDRARMVRDLVPARHLLDATTFARVTAMTSPADRTDDNAAALAAAAFRLGDPAAGRLLAALPDTTRPDAAAVAFGTDMRALRWDRAARRHLDGPSADALRSLASAFAGRPAETGTHTIEMPGSGGSDLEREIWTTTGTAIEQFAAGDVVASIGTASEACDDAEHGDLGGTSGITPHLVAGLLALAGGDPGAAVALLGRAVANDVGGPGEARAHRLLLAYASIQRGEYSSALDLVRTGDDDTWAHRDRLLLAALDASIARRSGDTTRLRDSWGRSEPVLLRQTVSWLLCDPLADLIAAGARLGDEARIGPLHRQLVEQLRGLPADGPGPVAADWVDLQVALATDDRDAVGIGIGVAGTTPDRDPITGDRRSVARRLATEAWREVLHGAGDVERIRVAAAALAAVDDAWEASRLLGQAALEQDDGAVSRALLEEARLLVTEPVTASNGLIAAGLSEREAEVARLVAEGRTHKEIGSQLYISPKTVEHHVARIRQRLGAGSRAELLAIVRELIDG